MHFIEQSDGRELAAYVRREVPPSRATIRVEGSYRDPNKADTKV